MEDIRGPENSEKQEQLIRRYCGEAERQLSQAHDQASALQMKESLCARFDAECESTMIISAIGSTLRFYSNDAGGTFEDVAKRSGKSDQEIDALFEELKSRIHSELE